MLPNGYLPCYHYVSLKGHSFPKVQNFGYQNVKKKTSERQLETSVFVHYKLFLIKDSYSDEKE